MMIELIKRRLDKVIDEYSTRPSIQTSLVLFVMSYVIITYEDHINI